MQSSEKEKIYLPMFALCVLIVCSNVYWFGFPFIYRQLDLSSGGNTFAMSLLQGVNSVLANLNESSGFYSNSYKMRAAALVFMVCTFILKSGRGTKMNWNSILAILVSGLILFFLPLITPFLYIVFTLAGFVLTSVGIALVGRKVAGGAKKADNDVFETFEQLVDKPIETTFSINIPMTYQYQKKLHHGYVPLLCPQGGTLILGAPGTGKSYSIVYNIIETMINKDFSLYVYDFKLPDLTDIVYNKYLKHYEYAQEKVDAYCGTYADRLAFDERHAGDARKTPQFCLIDFDNPRRSMRCNPMSPRYIRDMADAHELANLIMCTTNKKAIDSEDFFVLSAKAIIAADIWLLRKHKDGKYCTFPHLIELMGQNYKAVFDVLQSDPELFIMVQPFQDALKDNAQDQLQGQIASARMPLLKFPSDSSYWVLTGDDFSLDINNPDDPKIVCMGNNPDRQETYNTFLSTYTSRLIKSVNHKTNAAGKRNNPCGLIVDEFPTNYIHQIDNTIATARSNGVCVTLAAQDKSQIRRDYGDKNAEVIFNSVNNIISGKVNGETAKSLAETFGQEFRLQESETTGGENDTVSSSYHLENILPQSRIETLSNGYFFGKIADTNDNPIPRKLFCGKVEVDVEGRKADEATWKKLPEFGAHYFNDGEVEELLLKEKKSCIMKAIRHEIEEENRAKALHSPTDYGMSELDVIDLTRMRYDALEEDEREKYVSKARKLLREEKMNAIMKENADHIRQDIMEIFESYGINLEDYEKKAKKDGKSELPDDISTGEETSL